MSETQFDNPHSIEFSDEEVEDGVALLQAGEAVPVPGNYETVEDATLASKRFVDLVMAAHKANQVT